MCQAKPVSDTLFSALHLPASACHCRQCESCNAHYCNTGNQLTRMFVVTRT